MAANSIIYKWTKYIEIDRHIVGEKVSTAVFAMSTAYFRSRSSGRPAHKTYWAYPV